MAVGGDPMIFPGLAQPEDWTHAAERALMPSDLARSGAELCRLLVPLTGDAGEIKFVRVGNDRTKLLAFVSNADRDEYDTPYFFSSREGRVIITRRKGSLGFLPRDVRQQGHRIVAVGFGLRGNWAAPAILELQDGKNGWGFLPERSFDEPVVSIGFAGPGIERIKVTIRSPRDTGFSLTKASPHFHSTSVWRLTPSSCTAGPWKHVPTPFASFSELCSALWSGDLRTALRYCRSELLGQVRKLLKQPKGVPVADVPPYSGGEVGEVFGVKELGAFGPAPWFFRFEPWRGHWRVAGILPGSSVRR